jgi:hypothetical protein
MQMDFIVALGLIWGEVNLQQRFNLWKALVLEKDIASDTELRSLTYREVKNGSSLSHIALVFNA